MKIQSLAVIFVIIMLPISIVLSVYTQSQITTLRLQLSYDKKLDDATYDTIKAFQLNTINSNTSDLVNSKLRDIEAAANTFFTSIGNGFNMTGYNKEILKEYVPALVFTMYDGYYIYSPYTNTLDTKSIESLQDEDGNYRSGIDSHINGEKISGIKPYIYYSCRYKTPGERIDVVITYSLDNYINIQGKIDGEAVDKEGYVIDGIGKDPNGNLTYRGITISKEGENLRTENVDGNSYPCIKYRGVKYYQKGGAWFSLNNDGEELPAPEEISNIVGTPAKDKNAYNYYNQAYELKEFIISNGLNDLTAENAVLAQNDIKDENGDVIYNFKNNDKIFDYGNKIEEPSSNFNQHRLAIIRYSIERNLSIAIANYNNYSGNITIDFQMPRLKEYEWDKLLNNISVISFLQGLNIGGKIYNGYSVINNNKNKEVIPEESIYLVTDDNQYHRITDIKNLKDKNIVDAVINIDLERKSIIHEDEQTYYYPKEYFGCYDCIVGVGKNSDYEHNIESDNTYKFIDEEYGDDVKKAYYMAIGRERNAMYRLVRNLN